jgi:23S rRNA (guanine745-N1)-methyltransferase
MKLKYIGGIFMKKRELAALKFQELEGALQCTICHSEMTVMDSKSLVCENGHSFDLAKQGYVNMLQKQVSTMYDHALFDARKRIIHDYKFYDKVHQKISKIIDEALQEGGLVFDAGSGEGTHLYAIFNQLDQDYIHGLGLDISKDGIVMAAKNYSDQNWLVGDLTQTPFKEHSLDIILSFLSPANYSEFKRIMKPNGLLIKIIPGSHYLKEIRKHLSDEDKEYENTDTVNLMKNKVDVISEERVTYEREVDEKILRDILTMTPLTWHISESQIESILKNHHEIITVDLHIILAKF